MFSKNFKRMAGLALLLAVNFLVIDAQAGRIRMHKVKDAPKTCTTMKEDQFLSRPYRRVWVTQRSSVVVDMQDTVTLVDDLGNKICDWKTDDFAALGNIQDFKFYIDEYKSMFYPYVKREEGGFLRIDIPFKTCSLSSQVALEQMATPKCTPPVKKSLKRRRIASYKKR